MKLIKRILILSNILAAILLLSAAFEIIGFSSSNKYIGLYPIVFIAAIILNILFIIVWIIIKWKMSLVSLIAIIISFNHLNAVFPVYSYLNPKQSEGDFKLLSYNVMLFGLYSWENNEQIKDSIIDLIYYIDADILCLQEVYWNTDNNNFEPLKQLRSGISEKTYIHKQAMAKSVKGQRFGLATVSKYPIVNKEYIKFENSFNGVIISDIAIDSDTLRFINIHMQSIQLDQNDYTVIESITDSIDNYGIKTIYRKIAEASYKRAAQTDLLTKKMIESPYPVFVCGDLNDFPLSYTYLKILNELNLKDSYSYKGSFPGYTWNNFGIKQRIDVIFYNENYKCTEHSVLKKNISDHYPIYASFKRK